MPYQIQNTPQGKKTLVYKGERETRLHSAFDPVKEASRAIESFNPGKKGYIIILGAGLGYHIAELLQKFPTRTFICVERDDEVVTIARHEYPEHIAGVRMITAATALSSLFEELDISEFRGFSVYTHRPSYMIDPAFYDNIVVEMNRYVSSKISDLLTRFEFEERWAANILANLPLLFRKRTTQQLFGAFRGYPGIIVSAGPSLKKNAALLSSLKDSALICCVDTSFRAIQRIGITPHIVMALDAQSHSIRHFIGTSPDGAFLLADLVSFPKIARDYNGNIFFSTTAKYYDDEQGATKREPTPLMDWVEKFIPDIGDIQSGGSVATSLFDFLLNAGCDPIILVGQDLAYTGREIHTSGTYHNDEWLTLTSRTLNLDTINQRVIRKRKIKYVEQWGGNGTVISDYVLNLYHQWFEDSVAKVSVKVVNATEGGARIAGAQEVTLSQLVQILTPRTPTPTQILEKSYSSSEGKNPAQLLDAINRAIDILRPVSMLQDGSESQAKALSLIADQDIARLFSPYLKKTNAYLNRHPDLPVERSNALISREIIRASAILCKALSHCASQIIK
jgi:hypothetical protein